MALLHRPGCRHGRRSLLGETSTCGGHAVLSFSDTLILRGPTVRKHRGSPVRSPKVYREVELDEGYFEELLD